MELFLIDAIAPFFVGMPRQRVNWSKVPFETVNPQLPDADARWSAIEAAMTTFADRVHAIGYNAASLDDVAHLAQSDLYEADIQTQIRAYQDRYRPLFKILSERKLKVYVTMDVLSYTPRLLETIGTHIPSVTAFLKSLLDDLFAEFPELSGVIMRVGESDGLDVQSEFRSRLVLKRPAQARALLRGLLPLFESRQRELVFRTWTVGAHGIGDLMWHRNRLDELFNEIDSPALTVSMKHGESDFFRYLSVNHHFFRLKLPMLVELQARREYEGCGEYPSFIGAECHRIFRELRGLPNLRGISVWCQTGGWTPFQRLSFLQPEGIWNEINTYTAIRIFKDRQQPDEALHAFASDHGVDEADTFIRLMQLSEAVVTQLLYIPGFASQKLFFRRIRVPPLLTVFWNNVLINHSLKKLLSHFVADPGECIRSGWKALEAFDEMERCATTCGLPADDIAFMRDTFGLLALAREYYFGPFDEALEQRLRKAKKAYKKAYPKSQRPRYRIKLNFERFPLRGRRLSWTFALLLRRQRGYRIIDHLIVLRALSRVYWLLQKRKPNMIPEFAKDAAMGIDTVLK